MPRKKTQEEFIADAIAVHGDKYTYENVVYTRSSEKYEINCNKHGIFTISGLKLISGQGCKKCGQERTNAFHTKSLEDFLKDAIAVHGTKYSYASTTYSAEHNITVTCPGHGNFVITKGSFLSGRGCKKCGIEAVKKKRRDTVEQFVEKSRKVHGESYDYSRVNYINDTTKVEIVCKKHGVFSVVPGSHKSGVGCKKCWDDLRSDIQIDSVETLVKKFCAVHRDKYDYSLIDSPVNGNSLAPILCKRCDTVFKQSASNHKSGKGCPYCATSGYDKSKPGVFYILVWKNYTKVGITNKDAKTRSRKIKASSGMAFEVHTEFKSNDGTKADNLENFVLKWLRENYTPVAEKFDGSTECFADVDIDDLLDFIVPKTGELFCRSIFPHSR